jgi:phosphoenolpyruvate phosphomutase
MRMKLVYSYYVLDIVHKGHLLMMKNAKSIAGKDGKLIVGILTDEAVMEKKPRPTLTFEERIELASAIKYVDVAVAQETYSPLPNVKKIRPDILMESTSHSEEAIEEAREVMESINGKVIVLPYLPSQSSTSIKNNIKKIAGNKTSGR